jgi:hypothetical protein
MHGLQRDGRFETHVVVYVSKYFLGSYYEVCHLPYGLFRR